MHHAIDMTPIATGDTDNRVRQFDFGSIAPGEVVHVQTTQSNWYFTRTVGGRVTQDQVHGVFVQTSSRGFGQIARNPNNVNIDRVFEVGKAIYINGRKATGGVRQIYLNGRELT